ncbi:MAG: hypothetical protein ACOYK9_05100 [Chlamydiia bacterium]
MIGFQELIDGLNEELGLDMTIDKHNAVKLVLDGALTMQLEFHTFKEAYCIVCPIEQIHQGLRREAVLKNALKSNHMFRPYGGHFGYVESRGFLLLFAYIPATNASVKRVLDQMVLLSKQAKSWVEAFQSGLYAPSGAFEESRLIKPSTFGHFTKS